MRVCCYFKGKKHLWNAAHNALWKVKQQQQQSLENWVHTQTNFIQYIIHSFMNANTQKMCCKKGTSQKNYPKIKIPPTKKYHPNCPVRESSPYFVCVCVCPLLVFPHECLVLDFSLYTSIQIYFVKHFPVFPYSKLQLETPRRPYTHM